MVGRQPLAVTLRPAVREDMAAVQAIYSHYVTRTTISFEEVAPTVAEMEARLAATQARNMPWLVAEEAGEIVGYTYAGPWRSRSAYRYTVEDSIYVAPFLHGRGVGRALLQALVTECTRLGYRRMVAMVGDSANQSSIALHRSLGFVQEGVLRGVGLKFDRWIDLVIMQRALAES